MDDKQIDYKLIIQDFLDGYNRTKNPLLAWVVFGICREYELPIPIEILQYLDDISDQLVDIRHGSYSGHNLDKAIRLALGFGDRPKDCYNDFNTFALDNSRAKVVDIFLKKKDTDGNPVHTLESATIEYAELITKSKRETEFDENSDIEQNLKRRYRKYKAPKK